jgi:carbon-monoxide dehydrogenase medium subunit
MKPAPLDYLAGDLDSAHRLLVETGGKVIAGGQSLGPMLSLRLARPGTVVDVSRHLQGITEAPDAITYGAGTTHAMIEDGAVPDATPGWLAMVAGGIAYRAVRNRGTIGGSLAHADPAADWLVTLTALAAEVDVAGPDGARREALPGFMVAPFTTTLAPAEVITGVRVPRRGAVARFGYWKFTRKAGEFAKASAAVLVDGDTVRIAVGAIEAPPVLLPDPAAILADPSLAAAALSRALPGRDTGLHAVAVRRDVAAL